MEQVPSEVWYAILGWLLATVGTAFLKAVYQKLALWCWEKTVLSRFYILAYDEERRDIYAVHADPEKQVDSYELVVHVDSDAPRYQRCMSYIARHFNRSLRNLGHTRRTGNEVTYRKNMEAYVLKPFKSIDDLPPGVHAMSRNEIIEYGRKHENRTA